MFARFEVEGQIFSSAVVVVKGFKIQQYLLLLNFVLFFEAIQNILQTCSLSHPPFVAPVFWGSECTGIDPGIFWSKINQKNLIRIKIK